jgi:integrase
VFARRVEAERHLAGVEHAKLTGGYVDPRASKVTFRAYAEDWRTRQIHGHGTQVSVEQHLRLHVYPLIGERPIAAIRPSEIQGLVRRAEECLAASTVAVVYGRVVAVFRAAMRDRIVAVSPCVDIRLPPTAATSAVTDVLEPDQVLALADAVSPRYQALIIANAGLALRPGELSGLTVERVDFLRRQVRVDQQMVRVRGAGVVLTSKLKTRAAHRTLPLPDVVAEALATHMQVFLSHPELLFTNERGRPIQQYPFSQVFASGTRRAGLPDWATPHDLRHSTPRH